MFLFADMQDIAYKADEDFKLLVETRIANHKQAEAEKLESDRKRIQAEEESKSHAKVKAEQEAKDAQEREHKRIADAEERARIAAEESKQQSAPVDIRASVVEHQDEISSFLKYRDFGKEENKVRAILVEFIKWQAAHGMKVAA